MSDSRQRFIDSLETVTFFPCWRDNCGPARLLRFKDGAWTIACPYCGLQPFFKSPTRKEAYSSWFQDIKEIVVYDEVEI